MNNLFCNRGDLDSEADVESLFVERLLVKLRYPDGRVLRKDSLEKIKIGQGSKSQLYRPDYVLLNRKKKPSIVIDAKSPSENPADYFYQVSGYALGLNQRYPETNPVRFTLVTNGLQLLLWSWDNAKPILSLEFTDFEEDNRKLLQLRSLISYGVIETSMATEEIFLFERPDIDVLIKCFDTCHNIIWKKEKIGPTNAFYEFAKIMFIKMREDKRIAKLIADGKRPKVGDFNFSVSWIREQIEREVDENPLANILFKRIRNELEVEIESGEKKRIFLKGESLALKPSTIVEVVRRLEHFDLHGIDEDLNGRMFETFLNATVRGKELGQFFTPRSPVKYMTASAQLRIQDGTIPKVFDGSCGSAGFLIEAMAMLVHEIDAMTQLTDRQRRELKKRLFSTHLWGIDANDNIARIARLNMYLHGDGGSKIFVADTLDQALVTEKGLTRDQNIELTELRKHFLTDKVQFDRILTNPPFSMSYNKKDEHEARVLSQYSIAKTATGDIGTATKSNVLFVERYHGLLRDDGELITVIDDTVLNGIESQKYRDYILKHFIVRQVVSLPFNTFRRAQAGVKTSILHLKRKVGDEEQGDVFMAIVNNIGHDDHKRSTPDRDNLPVLKQHFLRWTKEGSIREIVEHNDLPEEHLGCPFQVFVVKAKSLNSKRIDAFYYSPELRNIRETLKRKESQGLIELRTGNDYDIIPYMGEEAIESRADTQFKYIDISAITQTGAVSNFVQGTIDELPSRARLPIRTNDVLFARLITSRGINFIVPDEFDSQLATNGFLGIRPKGEDEALLLWTILKSDICVKQIYYLAVTALQPELRDETFRAEFLIPIPKLDSDRRKLIENAREIISLHERVRSKLKDGKSSAKGMFEEQ